LQGANANFGRDMLLAGKKKGKFCWWQLNFEHQDCFLDNLMYTYRDTFNYVASFIYGSFVKMPEKKSFDQIVLPSYGTEGV
jgi:hypothetical protein